MRRSERLEKEREQARKEARILEARRKTKIKNVQFVIEGNITQARIRVEELLFCYYLPLPLDSYSGMKTYIDRSLKMANYNGETTTLCYEFAPIESEQPENNQEA